MGICLWIPNIQIRHLNLLLCVATSLHRNWPGVVQQELQWSFKECFVSAGRASWFAWISIALQAHSRWRVQDGKDNTIHQGESLLTRLINLSSLGKRKSNRMHDWDAVIEYCGGHAIAHLIMEQNKYLVQDIAKGIWIICTYPWALALYAGHAWKICPHEVYILAFNQICTHNLNSVINGRLS